MGLFWGKKGYCRRVLGAMKVLVTGGLGFIGSHLVDKLLRLGNKVIIVDDLSNGNIENISHIKDKEKIDIIKKDIRKLKKSVFKGVDFVFHQAALKSVAKSFIIPNDYYSVNVLGSLNIVLLAKEAGVKKVIMASSSSVYGEQSVFPQKEDAVLKPKSPYAGSKLAMEVLYNIYGKEIPIVCLRYFNVYGVRQSANDEYSAVIPKFISAVLKGEKPIIFGDGEQERDFTYINNVIDANISAMTRGEGIYNVGNGTHKSINQLLNYIKFTTGIYCDAEYKEARKGDIRKTNASIEKISTELLWEPKISFEEGLNLTIKGFSNAI